MVDVSDLFQKYEEQNNVYIALLKRIQQQEEDIMHLRKETRKLQQEISNDDT